MSVYVRQDESDTACLVCGYEPPEGQKWPHLSHWTGLGYLGGWYRSVCSVQCAYSLGRGDEREVREGRQP